MKKLLMITAFAALCGGAAHANPLYETGADYYATCSKLKADTEHLTMGELPPGNIRCTSVMVNALADWAFGDSAGSPLGRAVAKDCPDVMEMPLDRRVWYFEIIDAIEAIGGPSFSDHFLPASSLIHRAAQTAWPRCEETARKYSTAIREEAKNAKPESLGDVARKAFGPPPTEQAAH